jgi:hypothetical protein
MPSPQFERKGKKRKQKRKTNIQQGESTMLHIRGVRTILRLLTVISATFLTLGLLAACGSSGTDSGASDVRSLGEIEALGSIIVNGVKYETEGAQ